MIIKTGYHAVYAENYFTGIDDAKKYCFNFAQFDLGVPAYFLNELTEEKLLEIKKNAEDSSVEITFHSPGDNTSLFSDYPLIRRGILDEFKLMLEKANVIGARHMTFHTGVYSKFKKSGEKATPFYAEHYENVLYDNLKELINASGNVMICVENDSLDDVARKVIQRLIDEKERLYLTLDTAKMYVSNGKLCEDDFGFFEKNKANIREIHIHDKNDRFGSHQTVGDGYVDFSLFKPFINKDTYLNFEVRPVEAAKKSKDTLLVERIAIKEIDPKQTTRAAAFEMWMNAPMPMVTLFKTLDVTRLLSFSRREKLKFNMLMCYCIGRAAVQIEEFYLLPVDGKLMKYDKIAVNTVVKAKDNNIYTLDIPFYEDLQSFDGDYRMMTKQVYDSCRSYDVGGEYMVIGTSALVGCDIDGAVNIYAGVYNNPFVIWGKYRKKLFKTFLPISFQFHHTQMDGGHAAKFLECLQNEINNIKFY